MTQFLLSADPPQGSLHTYIQPVYVAWLCLHLLFFNFIWTFYTIESRRINNKAQLFKHFSGLFLATYNFFAQAPHTHTHTLLYSSLSRRFVLPLVQRFQRCGRPCSPNLPIYPPFAKVQTHSAQTLSGFRQHHFHLTRGGGTRAAN